MMTLLQAMVLDTTTVATNVGCTWFEWKVTVGDVLTLVGIIVAIIEYGVSSHKSRVQTLSSQKETWFLNVIVLPQLGDINNFYQKLITNIENDKAAVSVYKEKNFNQCLFEVADLKKKRKDEINDFFDHVSALVMSYDEDLGREVNGVIMLLEDVYVKAIDGYTKGEEVENIRAQFLQNKQQLIAKLNSGLKK